MYTTYQKVASLERELRLRHKVYPRRVAAGQMEQGDADHEIGVMAELLEEYRARLRAEQAVERRRYAPSLFDP